MTNLRQACRMSSAYSRQSSSCLPDIHRLALDRGPHARLQRIRGDEVHPPSEGVCQVGAEPHVREGIPWNDFIRMTPQEKRKAGAKI